MYNNGKDIGIKNLNQNVCNTPSNRDLKRGMCMKGNVYPGDYKERCPICNGKFKHFEPNGLWCPDHPQCKPNSYQVRFGNLTNRFKIYEKAYRRLTGWRYESDIGKFDSRDYRQDNPLGFANLVDKFLHSKRLLKGIRKYRERLNFAVEKFQNCNVKELDFFHFEELFNDLKENGYSSKYRGLIKQTLIMFYKWLNKGRNPIINYMPDFPQFRVSMKLKKLAKKDTQNQILEEIHRLTWKFNPRICIGTRFLATYFNTRPIELIRAKEKDFDLIDGMIWLSDKNSDEEDAKYIALLPEDIELLKSEIKRVENQYGKAHPELHFFRHIKGRGGNQPNSPFGKGYLYKWWVKACKNLGLKITLYGGTRHSTQVALRQKGHTSKDIKRAAMTKTDEAHMRYLQVTGDELRSLYADARPDNVLIKFSGVSENNKLLKTLSKPGARGET
jgi:integrase